MKKFFLDGVLVVEGKQDKAFLSNYVESPIFVLNGLDTKNRHIEIMKKYCKDITFFVLTDPDEAGILIRENLRKHNIEFIDLFLEKNESVRGKKHGVAECKTEFVLELLKKYGTENRKVTDKCASILYRYNLIGPGSKTNRTKICNYLGVDYLAGKSFKYLLEILNVDERKIEEMLQKDGN